MPEDNQGSATLEAVLAQENLRAAWLAVKANDGAPGVDKMDMEQSERHLRKHWDSIREKLQTGQYKPGAVRAVKIPKASGGERQLGIDSLPPPFPLALRAACGSLCRSAPFPILRIA
jgi:RNA-directed DNA polymerase